LVSQTQPQHQYGRYGAEHPNDTDAYLWPAALRQLTNLPAGSHVLDAGCGNGHFAEALRQKGYEVVGIDLEPTAIAHARERCPGGRFEVTSVYDDLRDLGDRPFDAVVALEVIEHLYDPRAFVRRARECLTAGGRFVVSTPYHGYWKNLLLALSGRLDSHFTALWDGGHIKFWSHRTLKVLLDGQGFRVVDFAGAGRVPYLWKSMVLAAVPHDPQSGK
jgi:2-polyprenyl-3-methyl-5-hydroxy-6-metoxy-1,4-benzoquinol methylase